MATYADIEDARVMLRAAKEEYLLGFGWKRTCNTPGAFWLWRRDFKVEDRAAHRRWKRGTPGPYGKPSEPHPYGVITADLDMAVSMTARHLDQTI